MGSFAERITEETPRLRRYARSLARDINTADDLVQTTVARALVKQHLWQSGTDLRAWLFTILHHSYVNYVRMTVREGKALSIDASRASLRSRERADTSVSMEEIALALSLLPSGQREVIVLCGLEEMAYEDAATVLGVPVGTVRSRLSRGRELLRLLLDGTCKGESGHSSDKTLRSVAAKARKHGVSYIGIL